jgi:hypothetical protein
MSLKEALAAVLKDMEALSAEELHADLKKHSKGAFAIAMKEAREFLESRVMSRGFHIVSIRFALGLKDDMVFEAFNRSILTADYISTAGNDNSYALAA